MQSCGPPGIEFETCAVAVECIFSNDTWLDN